MTDQQKEEWLAKNQNAYKAFQDFAYAVARTGRKFGFKAVAERVRWESYFRKHNGYKWSNSVTTYAGKKFIQQYPQFSNQVSFKGENNE